MDLRHDRTRFLDSKQGILSPIVATTRTVFLWPAYIHWPSALGRLTGIMGYLVQSKIWTLAVRNLPSPPSREVEIGVA
jgi:hypothetical protein